jgi:hypothetical protein
LQATCGSVTVNASNYVKVSTRDITGVLSTCKDSSKCKGGSFRYGFEEHVWKATLALTSQSCCLWELGWTACCRSGSITTGQAGQNLYVSATLNNCLAACNNSPDFAETPQIVVCNNRDVILKFNAQDKQDTIDFMSYHLEPAFQGPNQAASYSGSFSEKRPLTFWGFPNNGLTFPLGFTLDSLSGELMFRPTAVKQRAVVSVRVKEWRKINGKAEEIGSIRRDIVVLTDSCPNNYFPRLMSQANSNVCVGERICLKIETSDDDPNDTVRIYWNEAIPGATFTNNNGSVLLAKAELCWTPDSSHLKSQPYVFTISARDNACPISGYTTKTHSLRVWPKPDADLNIQEFGCGFVSLDKSLKGNFGTPATVWEITDSLKNRVFGSSQSSDTIQLLSGVYAVKLRLRLSYSCIRDYHDTITIIPYQFMLLNLGVIQQGNELLADTGYALYQWYDSSNKLVQKGVSNKIYLSQPGIYSVKAYDSAFCKEAKSMPVQVTVLSNETFTRPSFGKLYPNPVALNAPLTLDEAESVVNITDALGREVPYEVDCKDRNCKIIIHKQGLFIISTEDGSNYRVLVY